MPKKERETDWIKTYNPKGETRIASPAYIRRLLGINPMVTKNEISSIKYRLDRLESPMRQRQLLELLTGEKPHTYRWIENRMMIKGYDLDELLTNGKVIEEKAGTQTVYRLKENE